ncbi:MAG: hydroxymethylbilane synthase [Flavobacteriia bacterium]|nr:hydroxymethylbilane synthase [Flavobacteriia bacterium]
MQEIIIGSRGSDLALWQAHHVKTLLENLHCKVSIKIIQTQGDKIQNLSFDKLEGKGFFTKEIELELIEKKIDLAVHSHKDLETTTPKGLIVAAVSDREDPSELLLINKTSVDSQKKWDLKEKAIIGTSSARRKSLIKAFRADLQIEELRGNVPTRIQKLREQKYDAILLAKAGVSRLNLDLSSFHVLTLNPREFVPAPAQGVLALQIRQGETALFELLQKLNNSKVAQTIAIERGVLNQMQGGCQLPLGVYCEDNQVFVSYSKSSQNAALFFSFPVEKEIIKKIVAKLNSL